jgi:fucose permease
MTRRVVVLSAASFGVIGASVTLPGTLLPLLVDQFGIRLVEAGSMLALQPVGYLLSVLLAARLIHLAGMRAVLSAGFLASAVGYAGFGLASSWIAGAAMMLVTGLGYGATEVAMNTVLIRVGGERRSNLLNFAHLFFGVGSFLAPALATRAVAVGLSWRLVFGIAGALTVVVAIGWARTPDSDASTGLDPSDSSRLGGGRSRLAWLLAAVLGVYVGAEMGIGAWLTKYLVTIQQISLTAAGTTLSLYWLGLAAGRLALSVLAHRARDESLIVGLSIVALIALVTALLATTPAMTIVAFTATGAGFSGIFPAAIALGGRHHPHRAAPVTSMLIAGAGVGGIVIPWTMSAIADGVGLVAGMVFYAVTVGVMILLGVAARKEVRLLQPIG